MQSEKDVGERFLLSTLLFSPDNNLSRPPTKGLLATQRFALGAVFVYQLALWYRFEHGQELCLGLKAFLKAA